MDIFYDFNVGNNRFSLDLSRISKTLLLTQNGFINNKYTILVFYYGNEKPEFEFEFDKKDEAEELYEKIQDKTNVWKESNYNRDVVNLEKQIKIHKEMVEELKKENKILKEAFEMFKKTLKIIEGEEIE